ncbi:uncharacterized protein LOC111072388 [Drosophila obscura]|uniref:uncharacterized protein LOC111072388 n=1 Tax=Drosophila obscura TaxID=7282 RepID=UPI001BB104AA|nr:uncharacterized protein LOC111072388 [Drosophila obscura]
MVIPKNKTVKGEGSKEDNVQPRSRNNSRAESKAKLILKDPEQPPKSARSSRAAKRSADPPRSASRAAKRRRVAMPRDIENAICACPHPRPSCRTPSRTGKLNQNGQIITQAILDLNKVATLEEIMAQLMMRLGCTVLPNGAYDTVVHTLKEGVRFGFLQMEQGGYCILPTPISLAEEDLALQKRALMEAVCEPKPLVFKPSALSVISFAAR